MSSLNPMPFDEETNAAFERLTSHDETVTGYLHMDPAQFEAAPAKYRERILFELMVKQHNDIRDVARLARYMHDLGEKLNDKVDEFSTPEGQQKLVKSFVDAALGNLGGGMGFGGFGMGGKF